MKVYQPTDLISYIVGDLQKRVADFVGETINKAENAGLDLEVEAGRQMDIAIENLEVALDRDMEKTLDKVDITAQNVINAISSRLNDVEEGGTKDLDALKADAQQWMNTLAFANWQPQLTEVAPKYVVLGKDDQSMMKFKGNFMYASNKKYQPSLELNGDVLAPVNTTTQELDFSISIKNSSQDKKTYAVGTLKVPYETGWVWSVIKIAEYKVWLGALPTIPGQVTAYYTSQKIEQATRHITSGTINADASNYCPARWVNLKFSVFPERGWYVIPNSVQQPKIVGKAHGSHNNPSIYSINPNEIVTQVGLAAYDGQHMGIVPYAVEFDEVQDVPVVHTRDDKIKEDKLKWGNSFLLELQPDERLAKIVFEAFDGSRNEYAGPTLDNPYLKIRFENGRYQLAFEVPPDIL